MSVRDHTFDAATHPRTMLKYLPSLVSFPGVLWNNRWLVQNFFRREMVSRFHGSMLGAFWVLLRPLFQFAIYYIVFGYLFGRAEGSELAFALFLFSGVVFHSSMVEALGKCVSMVATNGSLVKKVAFPSEVLAVPTCAVAVVIYLVGALLVLLIGMGSGVLPPTWRLVGLPLVMIIWFCFMLGFGMLLATLQVFVKDTQLLWQLVTMAWFFGSPVFWGPDFLIKRMVEMDLPTGIAHAWFMINPAFSLLMSSRYALGAPEDLAYGITFGNQVLVAAVWAAVMLAFGYSLYMSRRLKFSDEI